jgi:hypothetical protein
MSACVWYNKSHINLKDSSFAGGQAYTQQKCHDIPFTKQSHGIGHWVCMCSAYGAVVSVCVRVGLFPCAKTEQRAWGRDYPTVVRGHTCRTGRTVAGFRAVPRRPPLVVQERARPQRCFTGTTKAPAADDAGRLTNSPLACALDNTFIHQSKTADRMASTNTNYVLYELLHKEKQTSVSIAA